MSEHLQSLTCQRCGAGFVLCATYLDMLERKGIKVALPPQCPSCFLTRGALPKVRGRVKWYSGNKHYGFIVADDGQEVFFHEQHVLREGVEGPDRDQSVRFHVRYPFKGPEALNVELLASRSGTGESARQ